MRPSVVVVWLLVSSGLAGCLSDPAPEPGPDASPGRVTDPRDYSYLENGTGTLGHVHDYWNGLEWRTLMSERQDFFSIYYLPRVVTFMPPDGSIVPQGADAVHVTVNWTGDAMMGVPELWVKTAEDHATWHFGPLANGRPVVIPVEANQSDLPHRLLSGWTFEVRLPLDDGMPMGAFVGSVSLDAVAHRGPDPLPVYPPHPDLWQNATELPLLKDRFSTSLHAVAPLFTICPEHCLDVHVPDEDVVVPYDAEQVRVVVTREEGAVGTLALRYHAADTRTMTVVEPDSDDGTTATYTIPVTAGDSPYAKQSLWVFEVFVPREPEPVDLFRGAYTIEAMASK